MKIAVQIPNQIASSFLLAIENKFGVDTANAIEVRIGDFWTTFKADFDGDQEKEDFFNLMAETSIEIEEEQREF
jgi:hypothetical protein